MFQNTKDIKKLKEEIIELKGSICYIEEKYIKEIQELRKRVSKKESYVWRLREEEVELIEQGKKFGKIRKILG